jgi:hypothetical protein
MYNTLCLIGSFIVIVATGAWLISKKLTKVETKVDSSEKHIDKLQGRVDLIYQYINVKSPIK